MPADAIIAANRITNPEQLVVGQAIVIPGDLFNYTVQPRQTDVYIARISDYAESLIKANPGISDPSRVQPGQTIIIPLSPTKTREILVNGFVFPTVSTEVLRTTFPYLSYLSIFSYQVRSNGSLKPIDDTGPITAARNAGVVHRWSLLILKKFGFSSELALIILSAIQVQFALIDNIIAVMEEKTIMSCQRL